MSVVLLALINIAGGASIAGINLAIDNFGLKLAPREEAIVYISTRNIIVALIAALAPMMGGLLADFFAHRNLVWNIEWNGPKGITTLPLIHLQGWNFLFLIGGILAILSLRLLKYVKEEGEVRKDVVVGEMKSDLKNNLKEKMNRESILGLLYFPVTYTVAIKKRVQYRIGQKSAAVRRLNSINAVRKRA
jgi:MFS family permease